MSRMITPIAVCLASAVLLPGQARSADCVFQHSPLGGRSGLPQVHELLCSPETSGSPGPVKITFLRLNEAVAGSLAKNEPILEFEGILKGITVAKNDVYRELQIIFDKFGRKQVYPADGVQLVLSIRESGGGGWKSIELAPAQRDAKGSQKFWTVSSPYPQPADRVDVPMNAAQATIYGTDHWPVGFKQIYTCRSQDILCTTVWTYLRLADLDIIEKDSIAAEKAAAAELAKDAGPDTKGPTGDAPASDNPAPSDATDDSSDWLDSKKRYAMDFEFFRYLGAADWPTEFVVASSNSDECGGDISFAYQARPMALDVAIIENAGAEPLKLIDIVGFKTASKALRRITPQSTTDQPAPLSQASTDIPPNGRLVLPLRIVFMDPVSDWRTPKRVAEAKAMYQRLRAKPSQSITSVLVGTERPRSRIRKKFSSFGPPELPEEIEFTYGPEISMRGLMLAKNSPSVGEPAFDLVTLSDSNLEHFEEPEIIQLTPPTPGGSCPVLYAYIDGEWVNLGKVIHEANGRDNVQTSLVSVDPRARKFRIAEEEPEISTIRRVGLSLKLRDGSRIALDPISPGNRPTTDFQVPAYSKIDLEFVLPGDRAAEDVIAGELSITGSYERYSGVAARQASNR
jgi:hypothetical protein